MGATCKESKLITVDIQVITVPLLQNNYIEGAGNSPPGANRLTNGAPVALNHFHKGDNTINQYQIMARTHTDAQPATVTLAQVNLRFHHDISLNWPHHGSILPQRSASVCDLCLKKRPHYLLENFFIQDNDAVPVHFDGTLFFQRFQ